MPPPPDPDPPLAPLPQLTVVANKASGRMIVKRLRRDCPPLPTRTQTPIRQPTTIPPIGQSPKGRRGVKNATELLPLVVMAKVTGTLAVDEVNAMIVGLKLQVLCGGKLEHTEGESVAEPVNPF